MPVNLFDLFKIWSSPSNAQFSSSMMRAGQACAMQLQEVGSLSTTTRIELSVYGSSAVTGRAQRTNRALMLGLAGYKFEELDVWQVKQFVQRVEQNGAIFLLAQRRVPFSPLLHIAFPRHEAPPQLST